jgi:hypothetical protein
LVTVPLGWVTIHFTEGLLPDTDVLEHYRLEDEKGSDTCPAGRGSDGKEREIKRNDGLTRRIR